MFYKKTARCKFVNKCGYRHSHYWHLDTQHYKEELKMIAQKTLRVAIGQIVGNLGATSENVATACRVSHEAAQGGAKLILFPEGMLNGNALTREKQVFFPAEPEFFTSLQNVSDEMDIAICIGFTTPIEDKLNNAFAIIRPRKKLVFQYKCARTNTEPNFLKAYPNETRTLFNVDGVRIVICICCEYGQAKIQKAIAMADPDLILHPSAGYEKDGQPGSKLTAKTTHMLFQNFRSCVINATVDIAKLGIPKVSANPLGFDGEIWWPGNSYAISSDGEILLWLKGKTFSKDATDIRPKIVDIPICPKSIHKE